MNVFWVILFVSMLYVIILIYLHLSFLQKVNRDLPAMLAFLSVIAH